MLFIDFMLSAQAQKIYTDDLGYVSLRKDMASKSPPVQKLYLAQRPNYARDYEKWNKLANEVFRSGR
jgi:ABC-type Fe3+ transport system substrate-binding protein